MREVIYEIALQRALNAPVPLATDSYSPVAHSHLLSELPRRLVHNNYVIMNRRLYTNEKGTKLVGFYDVQDAESNISDELGLRMSIGFKNSYDKSMVAALAVGAIVIVCSNGVICGDLITFKRKHTGTILQELHEKIEQAITSMNTSFARILTDIEIMKNCRVTLRQKSEILGVMYVEKDLLTPTQFSMVKRELKMSEHFKGDTLWDLYNNVTSVLKKSHPMYYISTHVNFHKFMLETANAFHASSSSSDKSDKVEETILDQEVINEVVELPDENDQIIYGNELIDNDVDLNYLSENEF